MAITIIMMIMQRVTLKMQKILKGSDQWEAKVLHSLRWNCARSQDLCLRPRCGSMRTCLDLVTITIIMMMMIREHGSTSLEARVSRDRSRLAGSDAAASVAVTITMMMIRVTCKRRCPPRNWTSQGGRGAATSSAGSTRGAFRPSWNLEDLLGWRFGSSQDRDNSPPPTRTPPPSPGSRELWGTTTLQFYRGRCGGFHGCRMVKHLGILAPLLSRSSEQDHTPCSPTCPDNWFGSDRLDEDCELLLQRRSFWFPNFEKMSPLSKNECGRFRELGKQKTSHQPHSSPCLPVITIALRRIRFIFEPQGHVSQLEERARFLCKQTSWGTKNIAEISKKKINANDTNSGKESEHLLPRLECDHLERRRDPDFGSVSAKSCSGNSRPGLRCFLWLDHMVMIGSDDDLHSWYWYWWWCWWWWWCCHLHQLAKPTEFKPTNPIAGHHLVDHLWIFSLSLSSFL